MKVSKNGLLRALFACGLLLGGGTLLWWLATLPYGCTLAQISTVPDDSFNMVMPAGGEDTVAQRIVCLTFDDGPSKNTAKVLDILAEKGVPATFFVMAAPNNAEYLPLVREEAAAGHQIALHSCSHEYKKIYQSTESFWQDIKALRQALEPYIDVENIHWLRFPGGSTNTVSHRYGGSDIMKRLKAQAAEYGYHYADWNVCADDAVGGHPSASRILKNVVGDVDDQQVCVVLMHDTAATGTTVEALPDIIDWFAEKGFRFCTLQQMQEQEEIAK